MLKVGDVVIMYVEYKQDFWSDEKKDFFSKPQSIIKVDTHSDNLTTLNFGKMGGHFNYKFKKVVTNTM